MICDRLETDIALYVGDDLPGHRVARLERHLAECANCRHLAESLKQRQRAVKEVLGRQAPEDSYTRVRTRVRSAIEAVQPSRMRRWPRAHLVLTAAAACGLLVAPLYLVWKPSPNESAPNAAAHVVSEIQEAAIAPQQPLAERMSFVEGLPGQILVQIKTGNPNVCILLIPEPNEGDSSWSKGNGA